MSHSGTQNQPDVLFSTYFTQMLMYIHQVDPATALHCLNQRSTHQLTTPTTPSRDSPIISILMVLPLTNGLLPQAAGFVPPFLAYIYASKSNLLVSTSMSNNCMELLSFAGLLLSAIWQPDNLSPLRSCEGEISFTDHLHNSGWSIRVGCNSQFRSKAHPDRLG